MAKGLTVLPKSGIRKSAGEGEGDGAKYPKTDSRHWRSKVLKPVIVDGVKRHEVQHYSARMQWQGKRQSFPLLSGNLDAATTRAAKIFNSLQVRGWEPTLKEFSPTHGKPERQSVLTVGDFLGEVEKVAAIRPRTLADYMRTFRHIVADLENISEDTDHDGKAKSRFNYRPGGGRETWVERVHAVEIASVTPARIQQWKIAFVNRALGNPLKEKSAKNSANSYYDEPSIDCVQRLRPIKLRALYSQSRRFLAFVKHVSF